MIYQFLIGPIRILLEYIYGFANSLLNSPGLSIVVLSLSVNLLLLPVYRRADAIQEQERAAEKKMEKVVSHIKKTFRGDERFMMLRAYYRENHYKPYYVLKGFLSLALEIPFFIAAYGFLSGSAALWGAAFGPVSNLGAPDGLLKIGGITVNLLPLLMTAANLASGAVYTKGCRPKEKIQLYGIAAVFLVLLWNSPSGLVLYWTLNNLFSLVKNLLLAGKKRRNAAAAPCPSDPAPAAGGRAFVCGGVLLAVLTGVLIPSSVVASSPAEFINVSAYRPPVLHVLDSALLAAGAFVFWLNVFYRMSGEKGKRRFTLAVWILCLLSLVNYMFFGTGLGLLSAELHYGNRPEFSAGAVLLNLAVLAAVAVPAVLVFFRWRKAVFPVLLVLLLALSGMAGANLLKIRADSADLGRIAAAADEEKARFTLSRNGKNVVFIMADKAIGSYFPYLLEEKPQLKDQFAGFTWYPNTLSFGGHTLFSSAALFGGYDYRPAELNRRTGERMAEKQNEALKVLPVLFGEAGYRVTVCDPPLAGFQWISDISIYSEYPWIRAFNTEQGQFAPAVRESLDLLWQRNFFCYGIMKCCPLLLQPTVYSEGTYYSAIRECPQFEKSYAVLQALPSMAQISEGSENTFLAMCNHTTHDPIVLSEPAYEPSDRIDNTEYDRAHEWRTAEGMQPIRLETEDQIIHYHANMAAMLQIGRWLDWLRSEGLYANTRIIIAADHGYRLHHSESWIFDPDLEGGDAMLYNPLLLVKDFGSTELTRDDSFMTNADVPAYLLRDLVENPVNPFTGNPVTSAAKETEEMQVTTSYDWQFAENNGTAFFPAVWYAVKDRVLDASCWKKLGEW